VNDHRNLPVTRKHHFAQNFTFPMESSQKSDQFSICCRGKNFINFNVSRFKNLEDDSFGHGSPRFFSEDDIG